MKSRIIILSLLLLLPAVVVKAQERDVEEPMFSFVDEKKPSYDGGSAIEFQKWVQAHQRYPRKAQKAGIEGRVLIRFTITKEGKLTNVTVFRGVHPLLDKEAVRVTKAAPQKWTPGENLKGEPVDINYFYPVIFRLPERTD